MKDEKNQRERKESDDPHIYEYYQNSFYFISCLFCVSYISREKRKERKKKELLLLFLITTYLFFDSKKISTTERIKKKKFKTN